MTKPTKKSTTKSKALRQLDPEKAGIDIGSKSIFVCISNHEGVQEVREFAFYTKDLEDMAKWLLSNGVKSIAMESTGIYWRPLFSILEPMGFELLLVNAHHLKNVPGRKTDVKDAQWIQQLHSAGLLRGSFIPPGDIAAFRAYDRKKRELSRQAARCINHMYKSLKEMNIQLDLVLSHIAVKTGLEIIKAIVAGERDPVKLAQFREKNVKSSFEDFVKALQGIWKEENIFELTLAYTAYEQINKQILLCEKKMEEALSKIKENTPQDRPKDSLHQTKEPVSKTPTKKKSIPKKSAYKRSEPSFDATELLKQKAKTNLTDIPGIGQNTALTIIAECGTDMSKFPTEKHYTSWLGLTPRNDISGGRVLDTRTNPSANRAAQAYRMSAQVVARTDTWLGAFSRRLQLQIGTPKAITATARKIACYVYRMLKYGISYQELGADYYEAKYRERLIKSLQRKADKLDMELRPKSK
jgi:transposase